MNEDPLVFDLVTLAALLLVAFWLSLVFLFSVRWAVQCWRFRRDCRRHDAAQREAAARRQWVLDEFRRRDLETWLLRSAMNGYSVRQLLKNNIQGDKR